MQTRKNLSPGGVPANLIDGNNRRYLRRQALRLLLIKMVPSFVGASGGIAFARGGKAADDEARPPH